MPKVNGAFSRNLNQPLPILVATHVGYDVGNQQQTYAADHSPLISFSTDAAAAWHFMADRTAKRPLVACELEHATHFMWKLEGVRATALGPGHFAVEYVASTSNVDRFRDRCVARVLAGDDRAVISAVKMQIVHGNIAADTRVHTAELIEPREYLAAHRRELDPGLFDRAMTRSEKWSEWLLYGTDREPGLMGLSYRFWLNDWLDLHVFAKQADP